MRSCVLILLFLLGSVRMVRASINVTDYGAVGDAVQFHANTVSNSTVVTVIGTNIFSSADIGKAIEVFGCGTNTSGTNCQDMVTTIANVVNGTNIYLNQTCQNTLTNTFATVGTDNSLAISNAIQSVVSSGSTNGGYWNVPRTIGLQQVGGYWHIFSGGSDFSAGVDVRSTGGTNARVRLITGSQIAAMQLRTTTPTITDLNNAKSGMIWCSNGVWFATVSTDGSTVSTAKFGP